MASQGCGTLTRAAATVADRLGHVPDLEARPLPTLLRAVILLGVVGAIALTAVTGVAAAQRHDELKRVALAEEGVAVLSSLVRRLGGGDDIATGESPR